MAVKKVTKPQTKASVKKPAKKVTKKPASKAVKKDTAEVQETEAEDLKTKAAAKEPVAEKTATKKAAVEKTATAKKKTATKKATTKSKSTEKTSDEIPVATTKKATTRKKKSTRKKTAPKKKASEMAEVAPVQPTEELPTLGAYLTKDELCQLIGLSSRRVEQLMFDKTIEKSDKEKGVKFETVSTLQRYIKFLTDRANGRKSEARAELEVQKLKAEVALKESQSELHRLRTDIQAGKYIPYEDAKIDFSRQILVVRNFVLSIPDRIAGQLGGRLKPVEVSELEKALQEDIKTMLRSFVVSAYLEETEEEVPKPVGRSLNEKKK